MFETGTALNVLAFHRMPGLPPPEGERHSHDYRIEVVASREELDEQGMVVDLDLLNASLEHTAAAIRDRDLEAVLGSEPVTVEVLARWVHGELANSLSAVDELGLRVRVFESVNEFGGYAASLSMTSRRDQQGVDH